MKRIDLIAEILLSALSRTSCDDEEKRPLNSEPPDEPDNDYTE